MLENSTEQQLVCYQLFFFSFLFILTLLSTSCACFFPVNLIPSHVPKSCLKHPINCAGSQSHSCTKISHCYDTIIHPFLSVLQDLEWFLQQPIIQEPESSVFAIVFTISSLLEFLFLTVIYCFFCLLSLLLC